MANQNLPDGAPGPLHLLRLQRALQGGLVQRARPQQQFAQAQGTGTPAAHQTTAFKPDERLLFASVNRQATRMPTQADELHYIRNGDVLDSALEAHGQCRWLSSLVVIPC